MTRRDERFRRDDRIRRRSEFVAISAEGRRVHTPHFVLLVRPGPEQRKRLGITVTKKVSPSAVSRNRVKRVVREVFRRHRDRFPDGCDVVVIAKKGAPELGFDDVENELGQAARRMNRFGR